MKNNFKLICGVLAIGLAIAFIGCSSAPTVFDKSVPLEQSSTLRIMACNVREFDGEFTGGGIAWGVMIGEKQMIIPAGRHTLTLLSRSGRWESTITMTHDFIPGHTYTVSLDSDTAKGAILDETELSRALVPNPASPNASQIEGVWIATNGEKYIFADNGYFWINKKGDLMHRGTFSLNGQRIILINQFTSFFGPWYPGTGQFIMDINGTTIKSGSREFRREN